MPTGRFQRLKKCLPGLTRQHSLPLRMAHIALPRGEDEFLITSLLNTQSFPYEIMKGLYHLRWGMETNYGVLECLEEWANFSGQSEIAVHQDFQAPYRLTTFEP